MRIGIIPNTFRGEACDLSRQLGEQLLADGHEVAVPQSEADKSDRPDWAVAEDHFTADLDLVVTLGGDGTVLRAVALTAARRVPLLPVNLGRLGYLAEVEPGLAWRAVQRFIAGECRIETRMTVACHVGDDGPVSEGLNEVVLTGGALGHMTEILCLIDGAEFGSYRCDALIVSTSTGSTAYALSAGGPVVSPGLDCLILVPVAAHSIFNRALILRPDEGLTLRSHDRNPANITVDGREVGLLRPGEELFLGAGPDEVPFVRIDGLDFLRILREKFMLANPLRRP